MNLLKFLVKHFIKNSTQKYDLISMDIAGPFQMQVALLYSEEFYRLVYEKLSERGVLALCLNGDLMMGSSTPSRIMKTLQGVFPEYFVIAPLDDSGFVYAGKKLPFTREVLLSALKQKKYSRTKVYDAGDVAEEMEHNDCAKISLAHMDIVLKRGWARMLYHYFDD